MNKRVIIIFILTILAISGWFYRYKKGETGENIKAGILHSLTGTMAISETSVVDTTLLAIEDLYTMQG